VKTYDSAASRSVPMALSELLEVARGLGLRGELHGNPDTKVTDVVDDSRNVGRGSLFVALAGTRSDGASFLDQAAGAGASCWAGSSNPDAPSGLASIVVEDSGQAAGLLAAAFCGVPTNSLDLVGITGTNGKTSTTYILESIWNAAATPCGVAGTIRQSGPGFSENAHLTTLPAVALQKLLARMVRAGARAAAVEVSSHALAQQRVAGCRFNVGVFTNLTRDHLDYHGDEQSYFAAKARLFHRHLDSNHAAAVLNAEDERVAELATTLSGVDVWTFSTDPAVAARVRVLEARTDLAGIRARVELDGTPISIDSALIGMPNLSNILAAAAAARALGIEPGAIEEGVRRCLPVPGRVERVGDGPPIVLVDYAHTPDALARVLAAIRGQVPGRLICVFGCGGDRDRGKRSMMGAAAADAADLCVVTSDNPRSEAPGTIIAEIVAGMVNISTNISDVAAPDARGFVIEVDRECAIRQAIAAAADDDVVVIAGKGHETYQETGGRRSDFDDREIALDALQVRQR
jgi:UDP-N-acetylmuramoyl-L-alanyl-D-glutamate--2,6-diaminopimelate ligase